MEGITTELFCNAMGAPIWAYLAARVGNIAIVGFLEGFGDFICASGKEGPPQDVVVVGDYNMFASKHVVDFQCVKIAAKEFFERGALSELLSWEKT